VDPTATVSSANTGLVLTVQLAAAYTAPVKGLITLKVTPDTAGGDPIANSTDPLLAFANGQRTAAFTIAAGTTRATVPIISTGTVASTVAITLEALEASGAAIAQQPTTKFFRLAPAAPVISSACYARTNSEAGVKLDFRVTGLSNTRELTRAQVTIPGLGGARANLPVPAEFLFDSSDTLTVEISGLAATFYSSPANVRTGGAFTLTIPVNLNSFAPSAQLGGIQFNLFNKAGSAGQRSVPACQ
jgi:hypothetical protein